jgi:hypothetical protein
MNDDVRAYLKKHVGPQDSFFAGVPDVAYDLDSSIEWELVDKGDGSRTYTRACGTCGATVVEAMRARHEQWHTALEDRS